MNAPLRIFVGFDEREPLAFHVFAHSILRRASCPVEIIPLVQSALRASKLYWRERGPTESTAFSLTRFLVPALCNYEGFAVFADCDMLMQTDVAELWLPIAMHLSETARAPKAVLCCQHDYTPASTVKFLGQPQTAYEKKNWSSFMIFNNPRCRALTPAYVNGATGLELHRFQWLGHEEVGELPLVWNWLVGVYEPHPMVKNVHFTDGGPWFRGYEHVHYADEWRAEYTNMIGDAPVACGSSQKN